MNLLFLDIDGVLNSDDSPVNEQFLYSFSPDCVKVLNRILQKYQLKIVLSSSWRMVFDTEKQNRIFKENGVVQMPYGQTPDLGYSNRAKEIKAYLKNRKVENFLILDDMNLQGFKHHFVRINPSTGLCENDLEKVDLVLREK